MGTYSEKTIRTTVTLSAGSFSGGGNTKIIEGLATDISVTKPGLPEKNSATADISNIRLEDMEQMTFLAFQPLQSNKNLLKIEAGERGKPLSVVFSGEITSAYADFSAAPSPRFRIEAISGGYAAKMGTAPVSVNGSASAADLIAQFAGQIGYSFRNEGISASVRNAVYNGSPIEKARAVAEEVGAELLIDDNTMVLLPYEAARAGSAVLITPQTGLISYPSFNSDGISFRCFYNPDLRQGGAVRVESIVPKATGTWKVTRLEHRLGAYGASDAWESSVDAVYIGS